jgi:co-chaperonin GroES (HSP10)
MNPLTANNVPDTHRVTAEDEALDFYPLWDYCLIKPIPRDKTKGGIVMPETAKKGMDDLLTSVVVKAGPGTYRDNGAWVPSPLKPGDIVYHIATMKPFQAVLNGKLYLCLAGRDIVASATPNGCDGSEEEKDQNPDDGVANDSVGKPKFLKSKYVRPHDPVRDDAG